MSASTITPNQSDSDFQAELLGINRTVKVTSNRIRAWLIPLLIVMVLIAIPLTYYFGYMAATSLNRIGIILNFLAGFLLAPELLGTQRLQWLESQHSSTITYLTKRNETILTFRNTIKSFGLLYYAFTYGWVFYFVYPIIRFYTINHNLRLTLTLYMAFSVLFYFLHRLLWPTLVIHKDKLVAKYGDKALFIHDIPGMICLILSTPYMSLVSFSAIYVILPLFQSTHKLINYKTRSFMIWWGIIFFIFGNALQFYATF